MPIASTYPPPFLDSSANLYLSNHSISGHQASRATKPIRRGYLRWAPDVTCEKNLIANAAAGDRNRAICVTGEHSTTSLKKPAVPQGSKSVSYTYMYRTYQRRSHELYENEAC